MPAQTLFSGEYQGGAFVEVLGTQGTDPLRLWNAKNVQKQYDKAVKSSVYTASSGSKGPLRLSIPKDDRSTLGLTQHYLVLQLAVTTQAPSSPLTVEIGLQDQSGTRRRLILSSSFNDAKITPLHCQIPFAVLSRAAWINLTVPLAELVQLCFRGAAYKCIDTLSVTGSCRVKRIFTLRDAPYETGGDAGGGADDTGPPLAPVLPRGLDLPANVDVFTQVLNADSLHSLGVQLTPPKPTSSHATRRSQIAHTHTQQHLHPPSPPHAAQTGPHTHTATATRPGSQQQRQQQHTHTTSVYRTSPPTSREPSMAPLVSHPQPVVSLHMGPETSNDNSVTWEDEDHISMPAPAADARRAVGAAGTGHSRRDRSPMHARGRVSVRDQSSGGGGGVSGFGGGYGEVGSSRLFVTRSPPTSQVEGLGLPALPDTRGNITNASPYTGTATAAASPVYAGSGPGRPTTDSAAVSRSPDRAPGPPVGAARRAASAQVGGSGQRGSGGGALLPPVSAHLSAHQAPTAPSHGVLSSFTHTRNPSVTLTRPGTSSETTTDPLTHSLHLSTDSVMVLASTPSSPNNRYRSSGLVGTGNPGVSIPSTIEEGEVLYDTPRVAGASEAPAQPPAASKAGARRVASPGMRKSAAGAAWGAGPGGARTGSPGRAGGSPGRGTRGAPRASPPSRGASAGVEVWPLAPSPLPTAPSERGVGAGAGVGGNVLRDSLSADLEGILQVRGGLDASLDWTPPFRGSPVRTSRHQVSQHQAHHTSDGPLTLTVTGDPSLDSPQLATIAATAAPIAKAAAAAAKAAPRGRTAAGAARSASPTPPDPQPPRAARVTSTSAANNSNTVSTANNNSTNNSATAAAAAAAAARALAQSPTPGKLPSRPSQPASQQPPSRTGARLPQSPGQKQARPARVASTGTDNMTEAKPTGAKVPASPPVAATRAARRAGDSTAAAAAAGAASKAGAAAAGAGTVGAQRRNVSPMRGGGASNNPAPAAASSKAGLNNSMKRAAAAVATSRAAGPPAAPAAASRRAAAAAASIASSTGLCDVVLDESVTLTSSVWAGFARYAKADSGHHGVDMSCGPCCSEVNSPRFSEIDFKRPMQPSQLSQPARHQPPQPPRSHQDMSQSHIEGLGGPVIDLTAPVWSPEGPRLPAGSGGGAAAGARRSVGRAPASPPAQEVPDGGALLQGVSDPTQGSFRFPMPVTGATATLIPAAQAGAHTQHSQATVPRHLQDSFSARHSQGEETDWRHIETLQSQQKDLSAVARAYTPPVALPFRSPSITAAGGAAHAASRMARMSSDQPAAPGGVGGGAQVLRLSVADARGFVTPRAAAPGRLQGPGHAAAAAAVTAGKSSVPTSALSAATQRGHKGGVAGVGVAGGSGDGMVSLWYDPDLKCYYDHTTGQYWELAEAS